MAGCGRVRVITSRQRVCVSDTSYTCLQSHVRRSHPGSRRLGLLNGDGERADPPPFQTAAGCADAVAAVGYPNKCKKKEKTPKKQIAALRQRRLSHESSPIINFALLFFFFCQRRWAGGKRPDVAVSGPASGHPGAGQVPETEGRRDRQSRTSQRGEVDSGSQRLPDG